MLTEVNVVHLQPRVTPRVEARLKTNRLRYPQGDVRF